MNFGRPQGTWKKCRKTHNKSSFVYFPNQYVVVGRYLLLSTLVNELNEGAK